MTTREISAGGVVFHRSGKTFKIALIKDMYGRWALPKGHIGDTIKDETPEQTAVRECSEEIGIPVDDLKIIEKLDDVKYFFHWEGKTIFKIVHFFLVESSSNKLKPQDEEVQAAEWFTPDEAVKKNEYENSTQIIKAAINKIRSIA